MHLVTSKEDPENGDDMQRKVKLEKAEPLGSVACHSFAQTAPAQGEGGSNSFWCLHYFGEYSVWSRRKQSLRRGYHVLLGASLGISGCTEL